MMVKLCRSTCCVSPEQLKPTTTAAAVTTGEERSDNLRIFTQNELKRATQSFSSANKVGEGGFGSVYKGRLQDGSMVAVKVLSLQIESMRGERQFVSELAALSNLRHENLVTLQGCCVDGANRYLVYQYMENNSLAQKLLGNDKNRMKFSWEARRRVSIGVARGIAYLHEEVSPHVLHRDIKSSNILLDENFTPKVSDFGLSRLLRENSSHISTRVAGTLGYLAPEYAVSGHLTRKSDVYSYGVLLMEIISGRSAVDFDVELGEYYLVQKAWSAYKENNLVQIVDSALNMNFPEEEAVRFMKVGLLCVQETAKRRPKMSAVVKMLNNETEMESCEISEPGHVADLMGIRLHKRYTSETSSSKSSTRTSL
ncbi:Cold-responsive protein kinase 1 [Linum grandiflorum]